MPVTLTIIIAKAIIKASRALGKGGGSALPGLIAERLDPQIGRKLAARIPQGSIIVTGTNGKTTTSKMLASVLEDQGISLVRNRAGSNLSRGVVSALIEHATLTGRAKESMGLFEVDEAAMPAVARMVQPKTILVLNLFRDQLDRYGELDTTAKLIGTGIAATNAKLVLNADDPLVAGLAQYASNQAMVSYFGVHDAAADKLVHDATADSDSCPVCGSRLQYSQVFYGHIGHYRCPKGHIARPEPEVSASGVRSSGEGMSFGLNAGKTTTSTTIGLPGIYNVYNAIAAAAVAQVLSVSLSKAVKSIANVKAAFGRVERLDIKGRHIYLLLVKNPTGFNQIIQTFLLTKKQQDVLFLINDNFADGRDVSWLWDVAFEELAGRGHRLATGGIRATDMSLRLKYAGAPASATNPNIAAALNQFIEQLPVGGTGYVVPTYTAMLAARHELASQVKLAGVWE